MKGWYSLPLGFGTVLASLLTLYLAVLVARTDLLSRGTSIGFDVITAYHSLCGIACLAFYFARRFRSRPRWLSSAGIVMSLLLWASFLAMNLTGHVWCLQKEGSRNLWTLVTGY